LQQGKIVGILRRKASMWFSRVYQKPDMIPTGIPLRTGVIPTTYKQELVKVQEELATVLK
jgi:hypothetical protein